MRVLLDNARVKSYPIATYYDVSAIVLSCYGFYIVEATDFHLPVISAMAV